MAVSQRAPRHVCHVCQEGTVEMRLTKIARRYLRTWFIFDLIIVGCSFERMRLSVREADGYLMDLFDLKRHVKKQKEIQCHSVTAIQAVIFQYSSL